MGEEEGGDKAPNGVGQGVVGGCEEANRRGRISGKTKGSGKPRRSLKA